jgi:hypothetical protein
LFVEGFLVCEELDFADADGNAIARLAAGGGSATGGT